MTSFLVGCTKENMPSQATDRACEQHGPEEQNSSQAPLRKVFRKTLSKILRACEKSLIRVCLRSKSFERKKMPRKTLLINKNYT